MLLATIDENHRGTYDFLYLPIDFKVNTVSFRVLGVFLLSITSTDSSSILVAE